MDIEIGATDASAQQTFLDSLARTYMGIGILKSFERLTIGPAPARRIVIESSRTGALLTNLAVLHGTHFISVLCTESAGKEPSATVEHILGSFTLVDR